MSRSDASRYYDARRRREKPWRSWYSTAQWQGLRAEQLLKQPLCERCQANGIVTAANVAHHKTPHKGNAALFFDADNLASLCADCHDIDEQLIELGRRPRQFPDQDGWPT